MPTVNVNPLHDIKIGWTCGQRNDCYIGVYCSQATKIVHDMAKDCELVVRLFFLSFLNFNFFSTQKKFSYLF
jgi:hypothetical protein